MTLQDQIKQAARNAAQFARVADQISEITPIVRTPADRAGNPDQVDGLPDTDCDVKLPSMIIVSGLDRTIAQMVHVRLIQAFLHVAAEFQDMAQDEFVRFSFESPMEEVTRERADSISDDA